MAPARAISSELARRLARARLRRASPCWCSSRQRPPVQDHGRVGFCQGDGGRLPRRLRCRGNESSEQAEAQSGARNGEPRGSTTIQSVRRCQEQQRRCRALILIARMTLGQGDPMDCDLQQTRSSMAYTSKDHVMPIVTHSGDPMDRDLQQTVSSMAYTSKDHGMPIVTHKGGLAATNSQAKSLMPSMLASSAKSLIPSMLTAVGCTSLSGGTSLSCGTSGGPSLSQIIFGALYRTFSTNAGSNIVEDYPEVDIGDNLDLNERMSLEKIRIQTNILGFEERYCKLVKPMLCLIAPGSLDDKSTVFLHRQIFKILKHYPRYISKFDIMTYEDGLRDDDARGSVEWKLFLEHLERRRVYIIEDKDKDMKLSLSSIETLIYECGIKGPCDGTDDEFYRGECDASFSKKTSTLSYLIWKEDKIVYSGIYKDVYCKSATEGEVFAAFALLSKAKQLKIQKLLVCSDCEAVSKILNGQLIIDKDHLERDTYLMLRSMRRHFKYLIATWKPRELMVFADHLGKVDSAEGEEISVIKHVMERCSSHLKGLPVFRIERTEAAATKIKKFAKIHVDDSFGKNSNSVYFIGVEEIYQLDCLIGLKQSIGPNNLVIYVNDIEDKPDFIENLKKIVDSYTMEKCGRYICFAECSAQADAKTLVVVFDAAIPDEIYYDDGAFHVLFVTGNEMEIIKEKEIPELTALAFVYFNGVMYPLNDHQKKEASDQTDHQKKEASDQTERKEQKLPSSLAEGEEEGSTGDQRERKEVDKKLSSSVADLQEEVSTGDERKKKEGKKAEEDES